MSINYQCKNPVLLRICDRPDKTKAVLDVLSKVKPKFLYVCGDGPRSEESYKSMVKTRKLIDEIDWPCEIKKKYWDKNIGGPRAGYEGISWFFTHVSSGIILEDDTLPSIDFFSFCDVLLEKYENDHRIFAITGNNFQNGKKNSHYSYYFSKYVHIWGWATWSRAWKHSDLRINFWPEYKKSEKWLTFFSDKVERKYWERIFDKVYSHKKVHWDYAWLASCWHKSGMTITPKCNLVSNIGFDSSGTNTTSKNSPLANMKTFPLGKLSHPTNFIQDEYADSYVFNNHFNGRYLKFPYLLLNPARRFAKLFLIFFKKIF